MVEKSIVLTGMKHSGKSTLAGMLAWEMRVRNVDLDELVEKEYRGDGLVSCREIYRQHGEAFFKNLEQRAAKTLAHEMDRSFLIASLGGGTIENEPAWNTLAGLGTLVYLIVDVDVLFKRIMKGGVPAFLSPDHPYEGFAELYEQRSALMRANADITVELKDDSIEESFRKLLTKIKEYGYAW